MLKAFPHHDVIIRYHGFDDDGEVTEVRTGQGQECAVSCEIVDAESVGEIVPPRFHELAEMGWNKKGTMGLLPDT